MREVGVVPEDVRTASDLSLLPASGHPDLLSNPDDFLARAADT